MTLNTQHIENIKQWASKGWSQQKIADTLNKKGITKEKGGKFAQSHISSLLRYGNFNFNKSATNISTKNPPLQPISLKEIESHSAQKEDTIALWVINSEIASHIKLEILREILKPTNQ